MLLPEADNIEIVVPGEQGQLGDELRQHMGGVPQSRLTDDEANRLMSGAFQFLQRWLMRPVLAQTIEFRWREVPRGGVRIRHTPVRSLVPVGVLDTEDALSEFDLARVRAANLGDGENQHEAVVLTPKGDGGWPVPDGYAPGCQPLPFVVRAECGWEEDSLPVPIMQAARYIAFTWHTQKFTSTEKMEFHLRMGVKDVVERYGRKPMPVV